MNDFETPPSWASSTVLDVVHCRGRIGWKGLKASEYRKEGPLFVSVREFNPDGTISFDDCTHISQERYDESPEIMIRKGDVLLCKDGSTIGKVALVESLPTQATVNSSIALITPLEGIDSTFVYYYFRSPVFQRLVDSRIKGAAIPHIFQKDLRQLHFPIPPLGEQKRIVTKIVATFNAIKALQATLSKVTGFSREIADGLPIIEKIRASILDKAFRGLLVSQDDSEGTGHELLAQIQKLHPQITSSSPISQKRKSKKRVKS